MKKFFKSLGLIFLVFIAAILLLLLQGFFRFDVKLFEINRLIQSESRRWGTLVELVPDIFILGEDAGQVKKVLQRAGYEPVPDGRVWKRYEDKTGPNKSVYIREANIIVCNVKLYVFLSFSEDGKLQSAVGTQHEHGCL